MTSSRSSDQSDAASFGNKDRRGSSADKPGEFIEQAQGTAEKRPGTSWKIWYQNRRPSMTTSSARNLSAKLEKPSEAAAAQSATGTASVTATAMSWWRRGSFTSLKGLSRRCSDASNGTGGEVVAEQVVAEQPTPLSPPEPRDTRVKKRTWPLWAKSSTAATAEDETAQQHTSRLRKPVINELIVANRDAILFLPRAAKDAALPAASKEEPAGQSHLLVPSFDILPKYTALSYLYSSLGSIGYRLNLVSESRVQHRTLYRRGPDMMLNYLSAHKTRPVKVLLVGVHGFFPMKVIRPLIGEPTGTSTKFITEAEKTVVQWFRDRQTPVDVSKIALEKEGKVFERVDFFFEVMKKWANEINEADFIYFVAHSQGCPVTIILLAKLLEAGVIQLNSVYVDREMTNELAEERRKKVVSVLAMAGINNGPFYGVDQTFLVKAYSTIENDSLQELFQFQDFNTVQSKKYIQSLRLIIASNVKITYVGSINDQLVPLYSSTCLFAHHPNIFRATFIDKDSKTPAFITRIVKIAHHLINMGYDDHNIVKEISASLAGTLTGGGHSKVYNEHQVYELGIKFALETTDLPVDVPVIYKPYQVNQLGSNPYHLPWCMRGLLYETGAHLDKEEIIMLFKEFDEWEPDSKQLKDVKYRLSGLKSKL
ncbi:AaceriAER328Wp [[Ashbya] aceris (nom. inval.)]|nr:AaceriAER328Wp [[Ashbya] aceris (nom. inval.)]